MQNYSYPASSNVTITGSTNGQPIPSTSVVVGGENNSGLTTPLQMDSSGNLKVSLAAEPLTPLATQDAADGTPGSAIPSKAIQVGGSDGVDLRVLSTDATGKLNLNNISGTISLPTGAATSANQATEITSLASIVTNTADVANATGVLGTALPSDAMLIGVKSGTNLVALAEGQATSASSLPVVIASDQSTLPVSAASLPLPAGAATSANQTNGAQKTQVVDGSGNVLTSQVNGSQRALDVGIDVAGIQVDPRQIRALTSSDVVTAVQPTASSLNATVVQPTGTNLHTVVDSGTIASTQSGTWSTRTQDGAGTAIGSNSVSSNVGLDVSDVGLVKANTPVYNDYTSTSITTGAYVQLIASTTSTTREIELFDSSGQALYLAVGGSGSEVNQMIIFPGGNGRVKLSIPSGSRVSAKAITATASSGFLAINLYG